jgi:hypothetical protein
MAPFDRVAPEIQRGLPHPGWSACIADSAVGDDPVLVFRLDVLGQGGSITSSARPHGLRRATMGEQGACVLQNGHAAKKSRGPKNLEARRHFSANLVDWSTAAVWESAAQTGSSAANGERANDQIRYRYSAVFLHGSYRYRSCDRRGDPVRLASENCSRSGYRPGRRLPSGAHGNLTAKPVRCD